MGLFDLVRFFVTLLVGSVIASVIAMSMVYFCGPGVNVPIEPRPWSWEETLFNFVTAGIISIVVVLHTRTANANYIQHYRAVAARARALERKHRKRRRLIKSDIGNA
jgi:hypothetical protein